ncbi:unnamed protein product, partial [Ixodes pacificus]
MLETCAQSKCAWIPRLRFRNRLWQTQTINRNTGYAQLHFSFLSFGSLPNGRFALPEMDGMGASVLAVDMRSKIPSSSFVIRSKKRRETTASCEAGCTIKEKTKVVRTGARPWKHEGTCRHCRRLDCPISVNNGFDWLKPSMRCWC